MLKVLVWVRRKLIIFHRLLLLFRSTTVFKKFFLGLLRGFRKAFASYELHVLLACYMSSVWSYFIRFIFRPLGSYFR